MRIQSEVLWPSTAQKKYVNTSLPRETDNTLGIKGCDLAARKLGEVETDTMEKETYYLIHTSLPREIKELRSQSAALVTEWMDKSAASLKWAQGTCPPKDREERDKRDPRAGQSTSVDRWKGPQADSRPVLELWKTCCCPWVCPGGTRDSPSQSTGLRTFSVSKANKTRKTRKDTASAKTGLASGPAKYSVRWSSRCLAPEG